MAIKTNEQSTNFPSFIVINSLGTTAQNDILTGGSGSIYSIVIENESASSGNEIYAHFYDNNNPTVGTTEPVMKIRNHNPSAAARDMHVSARFGIAFSNALSVAGSTAADGTGAPGASVHNLIILGD